MILEPPNVDWINETPSFARSAPNENFSFESPTSSSMNTPDTSVFDMDKTEQENFGQNMRDSAFVNDIVDIIDDYANKTQSTFYPADDDEEDLSELSQQFTITPRVLTSLPLKRARRQSSVYQDTISIISEENLSSIDKKRRVVSIYDRENYGNEHSTYNPGLSRTLSSARRGEAKTTTPTFSMFRTQSLAKRCSDRASVNTHLVTNGIRPSESAKNSIGTNFYQLTSVDLQGNPFNFRELQNKVVLVVNISFYGKLASKNFKFLNYLQEKYADDLMIVGFPCNQFKLRNKSQSGSHTRSASFSDLNSKAVLKSTHSRWGSTFTMTLESLRNTGENIEEMIQKQNLKFPVFNEVKVNGKHTSDIYAYLKNEKNGVFGTKFIKWNFEKFIIDRHGNVHKRFSCLKNVNQIELVINYLIEDKDVVIDDCRTLVGFNQDMFT